MLVVAADDSVMPQTVEAINHAKAAGVPIIVAINKIDKNGADPNRVRTQLLNHEIVVEEMGGDVLDVEVSAVTRKGLDTLLENIALQAELLDLKANPDRQAEGAVIEAKLDVGRGPVATVLVQKGTLKRGDIFVVGEQWGRVRALINDKGERIDEAGPSVPVEVLGLSGTPEAGDVLNVVDDEAKAREIASYRERLSRDKRAAVGSATTLDQLLAKAKADRDLKELPVVVKSDVQGSAEAIVQALEKLSTDEVRIRVLHSGVGAITELDVTLAEASGAPIIGFNVRANAPARESANQKGVEIRYYSIIYNLVDDVKAAASGLLSPEIREKFIGYATILQVFKITGVGKVAGCRVTEGVARRSAGVRLLARQRGDPRGQAEDAQALQGRGARGPGRPGMRHGLRALRRHARGRRHRDLRDRDRRAPARLIALPTRRLTGRRAIAFASCSRAASERFSPEAVPRRSPHTSRHQRMIAFCACSRFSASSKTTECGPSITALVTSSSRCAGRQCMKSAPGLAAAITASLT